MEKASIKKNSHSLASIYLKRNLLIKEQSVPNDYIHDLNILRKLSHGFIKDKQHIVDKLNIGCPLPKNSI